MANNSDNKRSKKEKKKKEVKKDIAKSYKMGIKYYEEIENAEEE